MVSITTPKLIIRLNATLLMERLFQNVYLRIYIIDGIPLIVCPGFVCETCPVVRFRPYYPRKVKYRSAVHLVFCVTQLGDLAQYP